MGKRIFLIHNAQLYLSYAGYKKPQITNTMNWKDLFEKNKWHKLQHQMTQITTRKW